MKTFMTIFALFTIFSAECFADSRIIGRLEAGCKIQGQVVSTKSRFEEKLLIIEDSKVHELRFFKKQSGGISYFKSQKSIELPPTFEARIMSPLMSRLSEVSVYLSGISDECLIEVR